MKYVSNGYLIRQAEIKGRRNGGEEMELNKRKREEEEEGEEKAQKRREEEEDAEREKISREMYEAVKTKNRDALKALCLKWKGPEKFDSAAYAYFDAYRDKRRRDALMLATKKNDLESIAMLLDANAPTYNKDVDGSTALMLARRGELRRGAKAACRAVMCRRATGLGRRSS